MHRLLHLRDPWPAWFAARRDAYYQVIAALALNLPIVLLALTRYLDGVSFASLAGLYAGSVLVGYYLLLFLVLTTLLFGITSFAPRVAVALCGALMGLAVYYLILDGVVYSVFRYHVDAFWLEYLASVTSFRGIGITPQIVSTAVVVLIAVAALEWLLFRLAQRIPKRGLLTANVFTVAVTAYFLSQAMHIVGYEMNDTRVTNITPQLPFYFPITSHSDAVKYAHLLPMITETPAYAGHGSPASLKYPLREVPCDARTTNKQLDVLLIVLESWRFDSMNETVSPRMHAFSKRSSLFLNHFSSGNSTPGGVFSLFYGIHPTYWTAVKANATDIDNPVLIDALEANGYGFGIFADSHFDRHKIKDTVFRDIHVEETFAGSSADEKDRDLTEKLFAFVEAQRAAGRPFFGFAFYKSTHFSYCYPKDGARFLPAHKLNLATANQKRDPAAFLNDYRNSIYYVDGLVGDLLDRMEASGALENTIVVITSDHGEEFNDNRANYWGHTGNFTGYQTRVPMIVYVPGTAPREVTEATAHVDLPPTLLIEALGCGEDVDAYSNGRNLFGPLAGERPMVVTSYVNHAIVMGDDVFSVFPMYVQKYKLWNIEKKADAPRPELAKIAMEGMYRFYRGDNGPLP
ncbi:MAG: sulfatase-like hydrolase/transferase [Candidatus Latescibacteria bacterium]|nr:sulfatase-like hydrolase/transferase [Candidatus Latescibacterota bacterium]